MAEPVSGLITILFTDLVGSTELLDRAGDEEAQQIFRAHHDLLAEAAASHRGDEVKWLGDGLMVAFGSAADAVRAATAMQAASRRPILGERLAIRVGLNAGEALRDATDYFGTTVVVARRLCDRAEGGQILCSDLVAGLLGGRSEFVFTPLGKLDLKGISGPVAACEVRAGDTGLGLPVRMPFVGRVGELTKARQRLAEAAAGRGGVVMVAGEPGIGKTRLAEELAEQAGRDGVEVLWGHCYEGEWTPPYGPFAEAIEGLVLAADIDDLRHGLGLGAPVLAPVVRAIRKVFPDLAEPAPLQPDEERFRLIDAAAQLFVARSERVLVLIVLDDLHWADRGTVAMLRHIARSVTRHRVLIVGTYRDTEVDRTHPLTDALGALPRETGYDHLRLGGLPAEAVGELLEAVSEQELSQGVVADFTEETEGNPFFLQEALRHLIEEGKVYRGPDGRWTTDRRIRELGIPEGVRAVIARRLARLPDAAHQLLAVAAVCDGPFAFDLVRRVADLEEDDALDALDAALAAQVVRPCGDVETCAFTNALIRHTVYADLSPPRRARLHRRVAEALARTHGSSPSPARAGEIASQYHRSAGLSGAEAGVDLALAAAAHAEATGAHDEAAAFLRMALGLMPDDDGRRPRLLGRLGIALAWARAFDEAVEVATEAAQALAAAVGDHEAAEYLAEATYACGLAGSSPHGWALAGVGLGYAGEVRDLAWARLISFDYERRAAGDPDFPGIPIDTPERWEAVRLLKAGPVDPLGPGPMFAMNVDRADPDQSEPGAAHQSGRRVQPLPARPRGGRARRPGPGPARTGRPLPQHGGLLSDCPRPAGRSARLHRRGLCAVQPGRGKHVHRPSRQGAAEPGPGRQLGRGRRRLRPLRRWSRGPGQRLGTRGDPRRRGPDRRPAGPAGAGHGAPRAAGSVAGAGAGLDRPLPGHGQLRRRHPLLPRPPRPRAGRRAGAAGEGDRARLPGHNGRRAPGHGPALRP